MLNNITCILLGLGATLFFGCSGKKDNVTPVVIKPVTVAPPTDKGWAFEATPFWSDEFDYTGTPDTTKWGYDLGGNGWGNNELEYYTNSTKNASVDSGKLTITAIHESMGGMNYTSARMLSKNAGNLTYGRIEVSAKLPSGTGTWPAIWMLPNDNVYGTWPASGEIDVMEMVGFDPNNVHFTVHNATFFGANGRGASMVIPTASTAFHKYRVDWTPYAVRGYYDDALVFTYVNTGGGAVIYPYDQKFHLLLNIAVGGSWGGAMGVDNSIFPTAMVVDYVRFYKMIPQ